MKLSEILEHIGGPLLDDRAELLEGVSDTIWSDKVLVRYLNEAQRKLCRDAWVLEDKDTASVDTNGVKICQIQLREDETDYPLSETILKVKSVRLSDSDIDLLAVNYDDNRLHNSLNYDSSFWDVNIVEDEQSARPNRWSADIGSRVMRVRNPPDEDAAELKLNMVVVRMPACPLSLSNMNAEPEVAEEHHLNMAFWAAGRALSHPTVDAGLRTVGKEFMADFEKALQDAKRDRQRLQQAPPRFRFGGWAR